MCTFWKLQGLKHKVSYKEEHALNFQEMRGSFCKIRRFFPIFLFFFFSPSLSFFFLPFPLTLILLRRRAPVGEARQPCGADARWPAVPAHGEAAVEVMEPGGDGLRWLAAADGRAAMERLPPREASGRRCGHGDAGGRAA